MMISTLNRLVILALNVAMITGHGYITFPENNRMGGNMSMAGTCDLTGRAPCLWFSQPVQIPGEPTIDRKARTYNVHVSHGSDDWTRKMPWRAPGTAPVLGSGCGVAGGNAIRLPNGGDPPAGFESGYDGVLLPETEPTVWKKGDEEEVSWAILANHGGGYSWRLCNKSDNITEECFQKNTLRFAGEVSWLQYSDKIPNRLGYLELPRFEVPLVKVTKGTYPSGSEWARNPIPSCYYCDQSKCGGIMPNMTDIFEPYPGVFYAGGEEWWQQEQCAQDCSGFSMMSCPPGWTQFKEPLPGISSYLGSWMFDPVTSTEYGIEGLQYSIVDKVLVPDDIPTGDYILSFRWDCEQSPQIWQGCADITIVES